MCDPQYLEDLYHQGFAPGPNETEATFLKRVAHTQAITGGKSYIIEYKRLPFWIGGMTYLDREVPVIRLKHPSAEILAHEEVHILRAAFTEPQFEELLAYQTSSSPLRRFLGPLFQAPWESYAFLLLCALLPLYPLAALLITLPLSRLLLSQWRFAKAKQHFPKNILILLTDKELRNCSLDSLDASTPRGKLLLHLMRP